MNKKDLSEYISKKLNIKKYQTYYFIDILIETISENLMAKKKIVISNFGTFKIVTRRNKRVINPNNKESQIIPSRKIVKFIPSKKLKDSIWK